MLYQTFIFAILFIVLSFFSPAFAQSTCTASDHSCEMYSCVEQSFQCGRNSYLSKFGFKNCEKYRKVQKFSSSDLKVWYPNVRFCLQSRLAEIAINTIGKAQQCQELETQAFASHVNCYLETGFCDLSFFDKMTVAAVAGSELFHPESIKAEQAVFEACLLNQ